MNRLKTDDGVLEETIDECNSSCSGLWQSH